MMSYNGYHLLLEQKEVFLLTYFFPREEFDPNTWRQLCLHVYTTKSNLLEIN